MFDDTLTIGAKIPGLHAACGELSREYLHVAWHVADFRGTKAYVLSHSWILFAQIAMLRRTSGISSRKFELHAACGELSREYSNVAPHIDDCRGAKAYVLSHSWIFFAQIGMLRRTFGISSRKFEFHAACGELSREYSNVAPHIDDCRGAKAYVLSHSWIFFAQIGMLRRTFGISSRKFEFHAACRELSREYSNVALHIEDFRETKAHVLSHVGNFGENVWISASTSKF